MLVATLRRDCYGFEMRLLILPRTTVPRQCPCPELQARGMEILAVEAAAENAHKMYSELVREAPTKEDLERMPMSGG